jgi:16S rRNA C967 or C1407 C5-methylase (RsmB/RsmF family)
MCAAPGSKTAQLIELLHAEDGKIPSMLTFMQYKVVILSKTCFLE